MSNNKQSSIEWLIDKIKNHIDAEDGSMGMNWLHDGTLKQAKAMHKEEKIKFATDFFFWWYNQTSGTNTVEAVEKYYNETFGGNK